jgi:hypothetical protein
MFSCKINFRSEEDGELPFQLSSVRFKLLLNWETGGNSAMFYSQTVETEIQRGNMFPPPSLFANNDFVLRNWS